MTRQPSAASVAIVERGRVLLIRRARAPYDGRWTLPGGRLEPGEDAMAAAEREVREELGLTVSALRPVTQLFVGSEPRYLLQVFATATVAGDVAPSGEIAGWRWVDPAELAGMNVTPDLPDVIAKALGSFDQS